MTSQAMSIASIKCHSNRSLCLWCIIRILQLGYSLRTPRISKTPSLTKSPSNMTSPMKALVNMPQWRGQQAISSRCSQTCFLTKGILNRILGIFHLRTRSSVGRAQRRRGIYCSNIRQILSFLRIDTVKDVSHLLGQESVSLVERIVFLNFLQLCWTKKIILADPNPLVAL
jgi:hypothetical protein